MKKLLLLTLLTLLGCFSHAQASIAYGDVDLSNPITLNLIPNESVNVPVDQLVFNIPNTAVSSSEEIGFAPGGIGFQPSVLTASQPNISISYFLTLSEPQVPPEVISTVLVWTQDGTNFHDIANSASLTIGVDRSKVVIIDWTTLNIDETKPFVVYLQITVLYFQPPSPPSIPVTINAVNLGISYIPPLASTVAFGTLVGINPPPPLIFPPFFNVESSFSITNFPSGGIAFPVGVLPTNFTIDYEYFIDGTGAPMSLGAVIQTLQDETQQPQSIPSSASSINTGEPLQFKGVITQLDVTGYDSTKPLALYLSPTSGADTNQLIEMPTFHMIIRVPRT